MSLRKVMKGVPLDPLPAKGILYRDEDALTTCQRECVARLGNTLQLEQESYLSRHPEIPAILETFVSKMTRENKRKGILKEAAEYFTKPIEELESEIKEHLNISEGSSFIKKDANQFKYNDLKLIDDIQKIININYPGEPFRILTPDASTINTASSSFVSIATSDTTLPTPEPIPTPEPTLSETLFSLVSNTVDKAIFLHVDEPALRYDTAYVELKKAVEEAMEVPVIEIKEDIAELYYNSYKMFELNIMEKERITAEIAWEKRMRKKLKRTLRRQNNFKGYETPPTPKSVLSSHESYKKPPPRPCVCHPQFAYNRYPKDRFGIYLPRQAGYSEGNITVTPAVSIESLDEIADTKSIVSKKSAVSAKSTVSKKTTFKE
ncbi:uncharacterized protein LOC125062605 [Pieris napi]|uniref:uncharacterized protein LOC125062605 n=1 Tax=Pieris napi TaxID=78633 RepID=UPI001FBA4483|nr:uncharacterized protein LOC125062605 [Pieris napi]